MPEETDRKQIPDDELDKEVPSREAPPLEFYPEREWLSALVDNVDYRYVYRNGQQQYVTNAKQEQVLDEDGNPIPRKEFNLTFLMKDYFLPNGEPRKAWLSLGASMSERAHLPQVLEQFGFTKDNPTPNQIKSVFNGVEVRFQVANKKRERDGKPYQVVIWDTLRPIPKEDDPGSQKVDADGNPVAWDE